MVAKSCSRSQGQPVPGVRSLAMISSRREISRAGVSMHQAGRSGGWSRTFHGLAGPAGGAKSPSMTDGSLSETALVLFSGGQDSTTCLAWALERFAHVEMVGFSYGQRHAIELECRERLLEGIKSLRADWAARLGDTTP